MHNKYFKLFTFIDTFNKKEILNFDINLGIILRNYKNNFTIKNLAEIKNFCKKSGRKIYLANDLKFAISCGFDGVYLPSFNKNLNFHNYSKRKSFSIIGSAHNVQEIKIKEKQNVELIFISPLFPTKNYQKYLGVCKFNLLSLNTNKKVIALGGLRKNNIQKLNCLKKSGIAAITLFQVKKKAPEGAF